MQGGESILPEVAVEDMDTLPMSLSSSDYLKDANGNEFVLDLSASPEPLVAPLVAAEQCSVILKWERIGVSGAVIESGADYGVTIFPALGGPSESLGRSLLGKKVGDTFKWTTMQGTVTDIHPPPQRRCERDYSAAMMQHCRERFTEAQALALTNTIASLRLARAILEPLWDCVEGFRQGATFGADQKELYSDIALALGQVYMYLDAPACAIEFLKKLSPTNQSGREAFIQCYLNLGNEAQVRKLLYGWMGRYDHQTNSWCRQQLEKLSKSVL